MDLARDKKRGSYREADVDEDEYFVCGADSAGASHVGSGLSPRGASGRGGSGGGRASPAARKALPLPPAAGRAAAPRAPRPRAPAPPAELPPPAGRIRQAALQFICECEAAAAPVPVPVPVVSGDTVSYLIQSVHLRADLLTLFASALIGDYLQIFKWFMIMTHK